MKTPFIVVPFSREVRIHRALTLPARRFFSIDFHCFL